MKRYYLTIAAFAVFAVQISQQTWSQQPTGVQNGAVPSGNQQVNGTIPGQNGTPANVNGNAPQPTQGQFGQFPNGNQTVGQANGQNGQVNAFNNNNQMNNQAMGNPWLMDQGAQQQMQLTPQQTEALNRAYASAIQQYQEGLGRLSSELTDVQRQERLQALQARFQRTYNRVLDSTLTNPQSRQRFDQLNRQFQGFGAFNDQQLQQQMNLSPQQQQQLSAMEGEFRQRLQQLQQRGNTPAVRQEFAQLQQMARQQMGSVLTPQQQQNWSPLVGENFDFPMNAFNGGNLPQNQAVSRPGGQTPNAVVNQVPGTGGHQQPGAGGLLRGGAAPAAGGNQAGGTSGTGGQGTAGGSGTAGGGAAGGGGGGASAGAGSD